MLHPAVLMTCIKLPLFCLFLSGCFRQVSHYIKVEDRIEALFSVEEFLFRNKNIWARSRGCKTVFILNSTEHEISTAHHAHKNLNTDK